MKRRKPLSRNFSPVSPLLFAFFFVFFDFQKEVSSRPPREDPFKEGPRQKNRKSAKKCVILSQNFFKKKNKKQQEEAPSPPSASQLARIAPPVKCCRARACGEQVHEEGKNPRAWFFCLQAFFFVSLFCGEGKRKWGASEGECSRLLVFACEEGVCEGARQQQEIGQEAERGGGGG